MPEPTVSENAEEATASVTATGEAGQNDETAAPAGEPADADATGESDEPVFLNRAARRTRGKGSAKQQPQGKGKSFGGRGSVQGPRQWGNRRSG